MRDHFGPAQRAPDFASAREDARWLHPGYKDRKRGAGRRLTR